MNSQKPNDLDDPEIILIDESNNALENMVKEN